MAAFSPTHTIRFTLLSGVYGEVDVRLEGDGDGPAYRADGSARWSRRGGRWLFDGGTTIGGDEFHVEVRPYGAGPQAVELVGTVEEKLAQLAEIERSMQQARVAPAAGPTAGLDRQQLAAICGRWVCHHAGWPPYIELELSVEDAATGRLAQHVRAGGQELRASLQVIAITGTTYRIQRCDTLEISTWRLEGDVLTCGERPRETVLEFSRQAGA